MVTSRSHTKRRILIVEDNEDAGEALKMLLDALGYKVDLVRDGESAVHAASSRRHDLIIMDVGLPGISGCDAARQIRAESPGGGARIVALTGWGRPRDRELTAAAGIEHHLLKPMDFQALKTILDSLEGPRRRSKRSTSAGATG